MTRRNKLSLALVQMRVDVNSKENNIRKACSEIDRAVREYQAELIVLPELFTTTYFPQWMDRKYFDLAEPIPGPTTNRLAKKAKENRVCVITPIFEVVQPGEYYDSSAIISPDGRIVSVFRKIHASDAWYPEGGFWSYDNFYFRGGTQLDVVDIGKCKIGQLICYDRQFPEAWRVLSLRGAQLVVVPLASMGKFLGDRALIVGRAMAYLNQVFAAVVNRVGKDGAFNFYGSSYVAGPDGELCAGPASAKNPSLLNATIDLNLIEENRKNLQFHKDRRPELYKLVSHQLPIR